MPMLKTKLDIQLECLRAPQPALHLVSACKINEGIIALSEDKIDELAQSLYQSDKKITFFIPASGSGSRMFHFLFEFLDNPNESNSGYVERFLTHIEDFAFFYQFPVSVQKALRNRSMDLDAFVSFILNNKGYGLAHLPKGLIPFHKNGPFLLCPIQEHVVQGQLLNQNTCSFHFTVQPKFQEYTQRQLEFLEGMTSRKFDVGFSVQNPDTNAIAFDDDFQPVVSSDGDILTRPAGHGALLENLNHVDADMIFVKNIDNIQHYNHSEMAVRTQRMLGGLFLEIQDEVNRLLENFSEDAWKAFNKRYQLFHDSVNDLPQSEKMLLLNRPLRVCGMVRNEGQPGGGPFWVENNGEITKQIVEKAQINPKNDQLRVMVQSSHFNPVMMVCQGKNSDGSKIDLNEYKDDNAYFKVTKSNKGQIIHFVELPGLWNGSMAKWNTVFVEIPSETFSPVKSILDLLDKSHQPG
ncbi:DUF4301 family protein [Fluviicola sp.]|uniref:DUF4301 family protein n=1 Tax=Fluviicola sp. TaxID=1917219 RepID=UPI00283A904B|nr:DUF4301 family protein [Fluviicola sp.]